MNYLLCLFLIIATPVFGAKRTTSTLRDKISNQANQISIMAAKIQSLEKRINHSNDSYLDKVSAIEKIERKINILKEELEQSAKDISIDFVVAKEAFRKFLLESSDNDSDESLAKKNFYFSILKLKMVNLSQAQKSSNTLLTSVQTYEEKLRTIKGDEQNTYELIFELENRKKSISKKYVSLLERKNVNQDRLDKIVSKKRVIRKNKSIASNSNVDINLSLPVDDFSDAKIDKKGIVFKFTEVLPVKSPAGGKVAYAGQLASYGKVIVVDHGKDIRSVLLGDMSIKVLKGDLVNRGDLLGYTVADPGLKKSLYYEVRKKKVAQNAIRWLSKKNKNILKI